MMQKKLNIRWYSGKKAEISYKLCACFDSECQHAAYVDGVRGAFFSDGGMPRH